MFTSTLHNHSVHVRQWETPLYITYSLMAIWLVRGAVVAGNLGSRVALIWLSHSIALDLGLERPADQSDSYQSISCSKAPFLF